MAVAYEQRGPGALPTTRLATQPEPVPKTHVWVGDLNAWFRRAYAPDVPWLTMLRFWDGKTNTSLQKLAHDLSSTSEGPYADPFFVREFANQFYCNMPSGSFPFGLGNGRPKKARRSVHRFVRSLYD